MQPFPKPKVNGQYVIKEKIGQGSFGQVFRGMSNFLLTYEKGYDQESKKDVAIKMVLSKFLKCFGIGSSVFKGTLGSERGENLEDVQQQRYENHHKFECELSRLSKAVLVRTRRRL